MVKGMKAVIMTEHGLRLATVPISEPGPDEVLVRIEYASVCGSDYPFLSRSKDSSHLNGAVFGHEGGGTVTLVGGQVTNVAPGDKVGIESHRARKSWLDGGNNPYTDPLSAIIGHRAFPEGEMPQGTFAEFITVPAVYVHRIPNKLFHAYPGSLWEPLGNAIRVSNVLQAQVRGTPRAVVSGCGPQGLMLLLIMKHWLGFKEVYATDFSKSRLELVEQLGIAKPYTPDKLPDVAPEVWLEMSGAYPAFEDGFRRLVPGGSMILFGLLAKQVELFEDIPYNEFVFQSMQREKAGKTLLGVCGRLSSDWELAPKIITRCLAGNVDLSSLYSYFGPLENLIPLVQNGHVPPKENSFLKAVFSGFLI
jgi:threonine 3-dehydrogenase